MISRSRVGLAALVVAGSLLACGVLDLGAARDNQVRRAVLAYEYAERGPAAELIINFRQGQPRDRFDFPAERTVWLYRQGEEEYFALRDPAQSYLYLRGIRYADENKTAFVSVERYAANSSFVRQLTLQQNDGKWSIVADELASN